MARKISEEIKHEAVKLIEERGLTRKKVCEDLGIGASTLDKWLKKYRNSASENLSVDEKAELKALRKENRHQKS